jgi:hypothetical protein
MMSKNNVDIDNAQNFVLDGKHYDGTIIPEKKLAMWKNISLKNNCTIGGGIFGASLFVQGGPCVFKKSVFVKEDARFVLDKGGKRSLLLACIHAERSLVVECPVDDIDTRLVIEGDVITTHLNLDHTFVYGNIYCQSAVIRNSIVLGSVYSSRKIEISHSVVGTFATRTAVINENVSLLQPYAVTENEPQVKEKIFFVFVDKTGKVKPAFIIHQDDIIKRSGETEDTSFINPRFVIGLGNRVLNLDIVSSMFIENAQVLSQRLLQSNAAKRDKAEELKWETEVFKHTGKVKKKEETITFNLKEYTLSDEYMKFKNNFETHSLPESEPETENTFMNNKSPENDDDRENDLNRNIDVSGELYYSCPQCSHQVSKDDEQCIHCGIELLECSCCEAIIIKEMDTCPHCGIILNDDIE